MSQAIHIASLIMYTKNKHRHVSIGVIMMNKTQLRTKAVGWLDTPSLVHLKGSWDASSNIARMITVSGGARDGREDT